MQDVTILVGTLDAYKAVWPVFCYGINKYWPDCPWPIKAATNHLDFPCGEGLKIGAYKNWSQNTILSLQKLDTPVVFWMLEDTWLTDFPDTRALKQFAQYILEDKADYIRLINSQIVKNAGQTSLDDRLFVFSDDSQYRTSVCPSIWNKQVFIDLLKEGESAWDFEIVGSRRSKNNMFCCVYDWYWKYLPHVFPSKSLAWSNTPVKRGKWTEDAKKYVKRERLLVDFSCNPKDGIVHEA